MPLTPNLDECVRVRIRAELNFKGCFVAVVHGWAVSLPNGVILDRVFLVGDDVYPDLQESIGPELKDGFIHDPLERALSQALWAKAQHYTTTQALVDARNEERAGLRGNRYDHARDMREDAA